MASIQIDSKAVIKACINSDSPLSKTDQLRKICRLAEYAKSYGGDMYIDHEDFALIGEYLPKPTTNP